MLDTIKSITSKAIEAPALVLGANGPLIEKETKPLFNNEKTLLQEKVAIDPQKSESTDSKIEHIAQAMDKYIQSIQRDLKIQVHQNTGKVMIKVISKND